MKYLIAYDLGTGGMKASLFDANGTALESSFVECETFYPSDDFREQRPNDWWEMLKVSTKNLLQKVDIDTCDILGAGISGHSLGVVPIDENKNLLREYVPIWSDARAAKEEKDVFSKIDENEWYLKTGNGFPARLYGAFKILWYKNNEPELYDKAIAFIGTKDYLNLKLTGVIATDHSYASGSGVYDLVRCEYDKEYIERIGLRLGDFPQILESATPLGRILPEVAEELGLPDTMIVSAGGVDNACMAAGAGCVEDGMGYTSLGTSSWIAVCSSETKVDIATKPYTFAHLIKGKYVPAESIFSAGNTFRWLRDVICAEYVKLEGEGGEDAYVRMDDEAEKSPIGANGVIMTPHLAGGTALDKTVMIRGSFSGLDLKHTKSDLIRATLEGICMSLRICLDELQKNEMLSEDMLIVGGGAKSKFWRTLFADIFDKNIVESKVGENAGSLGAMATAAIATGLWKDYSKLTEINAPISKIEKNSDNVKKYDVLLKRFKLICDYQSEIADVLNKSM